MRQDKFSRSSLILYICGIIPVVWLALLVAPAFGDGLVGFLNNAGTAFANPLHIEICEDSVKAVLILLLCYGMGIAIYLSNDRNYRRREEHGSAKWGSPNSVNKKYADKEKTENKLLTQNVAIGLDGRKHRRNLNVLVCGGSGSGKTRFFAKWLGHSDFSTTANIYAHLEFSSKISSADALLLGLNLGANP